jgi:hypothetical protein
VDLDDVVHVGTGQARRHQYLDDQLVARRRGQVRRRAQPARQLPLALTGDAETLLRSGVRRVVGLDEPVPFQPLQGRVDLSHIQRPHLAGARHELLAQLQSVLRALAQQREQGVPDAHDVLRPVSMPRMLLSI